MMPKISARIKLFLVITGFVIFTGFMFMYGYGILEARNQVMLDEVAKKNLELEVLRREQKNFEQGQKDISILEDKEYPPEELFSRDTKVVKEIKQLEDLAAQYSLQLTLSVAGTTKTATPATGVSGQLFIVPYTVTLEGVYPNIERYLQSAEHTSFINHTAGVEIIALPNGNVQTTLNSQFFLKQK